MSAGLSSSGARVRGDDYQHLFAWIQALRALEGDVVRLRVEDASAGNADDVTALGKNGEWHCYQTKHSTDRRRAADVDWITKPAKGGGPGMLQGFYKLWSGSPENRPKIHLVTSRHPAPGDLLACADGEDDTLVRRLRSKSGSEDLALLARHLGTDAGEALLFMSDVRFELARSKRLLEEEARTRMRAAGLRSDDDALAQGVQIVRGWVVEGKREIDAREARLAAERLRRTDSAAASLLVQMIDRDANPGDADVALDWTGMFPGDGPGTRCLPSDPALWNGLFKPRLRQAARDLRSAAGARVSVRGYMRLPTWFVVGAEFGKTAGFEVSSVQGGEAWSSEGDLADVRVECDVTDLGAGGDLAVGIAPSYDLSADVLEHLRGGGIGAGRYALVRPAGGEGGRAIAGAAEARGWAFRTRDSVRRLAAEHRPGLLHLFLAGPHAAVLLLGHLWDRMPRTQLYEHLGPAGGYAPSYVVPD